jgi:hypothetical protein
MNITVGPPVGDRVVEDSAGRLFVPPDTTDILIDRELFVTVHPRGSGNVAGQDQAAGPETGWAAQGGQ